METAKVEKIGFIYNDTNLSFNVDKSYDIHYEAGYFRFLADQLSKTCHYSITFHL